ncbi:unnamed protein product [Musa hybrid cultivar]
MKHQIDEQASQTRRGDIRSMRMNAFKNQPRHIDSRSHNPRLALNLTIKISGC